MSARRTSRGPSPRCLGVPPIHYLSLLRAERAAVMLVRTDDSVAFIGAAVGWPDPAYFSRRFRAVYGVSPRDYRHRHRGEVGSQARAAGDALALGFGQRKSVQELVKEGQVRRIDAQPHAGGSNAPEAPIRRAVLPPARRRITRSEEEERMRHSSQDATGRPSIAAALADRRLQQRFQRCNRAASAAAPAVKHQRHRSPTASAVSDEPVTLTYYVDDNNVTQARLQGLDRRVHGPPPERHLRDRDAPGRHRRRQHRQDPAGDRRDDRHLLLQLRLAAPGAEPDRDARRPDGEPFIDNIVRVVPADGVRRRRRLRRPDRGSHRRRHPVQQEDLRATSACRSRRPGRSSRRTTRRSRPPDHPGRATYGDTWTSQLFVLADYYNVQAAVPDFAEQYTANKAKYADTPAALAGFQHLQEGIEKGWYQKDFGRPTTSTTARAARRRASAPTTRC